MMKMLQIIMPIPVSTNSEPMTEESAKGMLGMFILLNILYLISLLICHVIYFKEKKEYNKRNEKLSYKLSFHRSYFKYIFIDGADLMFCEIINWFAGIVDIAVLFISIGILIGKMF